MGAKNIQQEATRPSFRQVRPTKICIGEYDTVRVRQGAVHMHNPLEAVAQGKRGRSVDYGRAAIDFLSRRLEVEVEVCGNQLDAIRCAEDAHEIAVQVIGSTTRRREKFHCALVNGDSPMLQDAKEAIERRVWRQSGVVGDLLGELREVVQIRGCSHRDASTRKDDELVVLDGIKDPIVEIEVSQSRHASLSVRSGLREEPMFSSSQ